MKGGPIFKIHVVLTSILLMIYAGCTKKTADYPAVIELVSNDSNFLKVNLIAFCRKNNVKETSVYAWKNHYALYDRFSDMEKMKNALEVSFPEMKIKVYDNPFYTFDRKLCADKDVAENWDNIILTANLVKDSAMQNEYMEYHRTQFEDWPEVSRGFCNADFQQLLVFRNGRQLMLVISIPQGEDLDDLNPKTTENNPRVDEWNRLMSRYQEGIEDAPPGKTWVFFKPVN